MTTVASLMRAETYHLLRVILVLHKPDSHHAYNAGLLDGEGHISVARRPHGRGAAVSVGMTNTDLRLLKPFLVYGGNIGKPRLRGYGHKLQYDWTVNSAGAIKAIKAMSPYLIRLKRRARIALIILKTTPTKGKHLSNKQAKTIAMAREKFYASQT